MKSSLRFHARFEFLELLPETAWYHAERGIRVKSRVVGESKGDPFLFSYSKRYFLNENNKGMILDQIDNYLCFFTDTFYLDRTFYNFSSFLVFFQKIFLSNLSSLFLLLLSIIIVILLIINNYLEVVSFIFYRKIDGIERKSIIFFLSLSFSDSPNNRILWQNRVMLNSILGIRAIKLLDRSSLKNSEIR